MRIFSYDLFDGHSGQFWFSVSFQRTWRRSLHMISFRLRFLTGQIDKIWGIHGVLRYFLGKQIEFLLIFWCLMMKQINIIPWVFICNLTKHDGNGMRWGLGMGIEIQMRRSKGSSYWICHPTLNTWTTTNLSWNVCNYLLNLS